MGIYGNADYPYNIFDRLVYQKSDVQVNVYFWLY